MYTHMSRRFRVETLLAALTAALATLTAAWPAWIEGMFGIDPDHGGGSFEWVVVVGFAVTAVLLAMLAWRDRRHIMLANPAKASR
jgi:hypothetical protein